MPQRDRRASPPHVASGHRGCNRCHHAAFPELLRISGIAARRRSQGACPRRSTGWAVRAGDGPSALSHPERRNFSSRPAEGADAGVSHGRGHRPGGTASHHPDRTLARCVGGHAAPGLCATPGVAGADGVVALAAPASTGCAAVRNRRPQPPGLPSPGVRGTAGPATVIASCTGRTRAAAGSALAGSGLGRALDGEPSIPIDGRSAACLERGLTRSERQRTHEPIAAG